MKIVLSQIQGYARKHDVYTTNRISEIARSSNPSDWYWIPSADNAADAVFRGDRAAALGDQSKWQSGPSFLNEPKENGPTANIPNEGNEEASSENVLSLVTEIHCP